MKKFFIAVPLLFLLAAGCNQLSTNQQTGQTNKKTSPPANTQQPPQALKSNKDSQKNEKAQNETKNWKTYRNDKYGFEFKYPNAFTLFKENNNSNDIQSQQQAMEVVLLKPASRIYGEAIISVNVNGNSRFLFTDDFPSLKYADRLILSETKTLSVFGTLIALRKYIGISDDRNYIIIEYPELVSKDRFGNHYLFYAVFSPKDIEAEKEFIQILSTFKFTK